MFLLNKNDICYLINRVYRTFHQVTKLNYIEACEISYTLVQLK